MRMEIDMLNTLCAGYLTLAALYAGGAFAVYILERLRDMVCGKVLRGCFIFVEIVLLLSILTVIAWMAGTTILTITGGGFNG